MVTHQSTNIIHPLGIGAQESLGNMPKHLPVKHHRENFYVEFSIIKSPLYQYVKDRNSEQRVKVNFLTLSSSRVFDAKHQRTHIIISAGAYPPDITDRLYLQRNRSQADLINDGFVLHYLLLFMIVYAFLRGQR